MDILIFFVAENENKLAIEIGYLDGMAMSVGIVSYYSIVASVRSFDLIASLISLKISFYRRGGVSSFCHPINDFEIGLELQLRIS